MSTGEILDPKDESTVREIMSRTAIILQDKPLLLAGNYGYNTRAFSNGARRLDLIGVSAICGPVSDAVTRAAQSLGLAASREMHSRDPNTKADHYLTSFVPLEAPLGDDDPVLCATWGQFTTQSALAKRLRRRQDLYGLFSKRRDIRRLVSPSTYGQCYSAGSVALRQTAHAPLPPEAQAMIGNLYIGDCWLNTTPEDVLTGQYPAAEVSIEDYPVERWEFAPLLLRIANREVTGD